MSEAHPQIHAIDLNYLGKPHAINSFAVVGADGVPVLVETGPANTVERLDAGLRALGFSLDDVRDVMITHIHLDHAAAAGALAKRGCRIHVHEFGAQHLIDPSRLLKSATRIYGDEMDYLWGKFEAVPESQVVPVHDNDLLDVGGLQFRAMETPGHARHHHAFVLETERGRVCFTGDAAATCVPHSEFISLPTPPPEFDRDQWFATLDRIEREQFASLFLTHGGEIRDVAAHLDRVRHELRTHTEKLDDLTASVDDSGDVDLVARYHQWIVDQADALDVPESTRWFYVNKSMSRMNVAGYQRWQTQLAKRRGR